MKKTINLNESNLRNVIAECVKKVLRESMSDETLSYGDYVENGEVEDWKKVDIAKIATSIFGEAPVGNGLCADEAFLEDLWEAVNDDRVFDCEYFVIHTWQQYNGDDYIGNGDDEEESLDALKKGLQQIQGKYGPEKINRFYQMVLGQIRGNGRMNEGKDLADWKKKKEWDPENYEQYDFHNDPEWKELNSRQYMDSDDLKRKHAIERDPRFWQNRYKGVSTDKDGKQYHEYIQTRVDKDGRKIERMQRKPANSRYLYMGGYKMRRFGPEEDDEI